MEEKGFILSIEYRESETFEEGIVMGQNYPPGHETEKGEEIALTVSEGKGTGGANAAIPKEDPVLKTEAGREAPFWTVVVVSLDQRTGHIQSEAEAIAAEVRSKGLHAGVLDSTKFLSLRQPYWVVYSGIFRDQASAENHKLNVQRVGYNEAYTRYVDFSGPGEVGPVVP